MRPCWQIAIYSVWAGQQQTGGVQHRSHVEKFLVAKAPELSIAADHVQPTSARLVADPAVQSRAFDQFRRAILGDQVDRVSGGPVLRVGETPSGNVGFRLAGIISEARPEYEFVVAKRADFIREDGTIMRAPPR